jgi:uncharacterized phosphosugar-binding protein
MHDLARYVDDVLTANAEGISGCADVVAATGRAGGLVRPAGAGHSLAAVLETFFRAGGLAFVRPLWSEDVFPLRGARASTTGERIPGRGRAVAEAAAIAPDDTVIVFSNSGINPYPVEIAEVARDAGATVVAFTSRSASAAATPRARARLADLADLVLDTLVPPGDVTWPADAPVTAPVSSLATTALWTAVLREVHDRWPDAPRWRSANVPGTDAENAAVLEAFSARIPEL